MPVAKYWNGSAWVSLPAAREAILALDPWHIVNNAGEPAMQNGWANRDVATYGALSFRKDAFGRVRLRGTVYNGASGSVIFQLPVGYRPPVLAYIPVLGPSGAAGHYISVSPTGNVTGTRAGTDLYIDNIEFDTDSVSSYVTASLPGPERVTSLPAYPFDGQEVYYVADATNGIIWHLRYNASGGTYKWEFVGGNHLEVVQTAPAVQFTADLATYGAMGNMGLLSLPRPGVYDVWFNGSAQPAASSTTTWDFRVATSVTGGSIGVPLVQENVRGAGPDTLRHVSDGPRRVTLAAAATIGLVISSTNIGIAFGQNPQFALGARPVRLS